MDLYLDGIDTDLIKWASRLGALQGVTTNPSIISESGMNAGEALRAALKNHQGPVAAQVLANKAEDIVEQAETLRDLSERIIVKIPVTQQGLKAMHSLSHLQLPIMATSILSPFQALLACHAGAAYLAPYYSYMEHPEETIDTMLHTIEHYGFETKLLVASLRTLEQVSHCLTLGVHGVTLKPSLFQEFIADHPKTLDCLEKFREEAKDLFPV